MAHFRGCSASHENTMCCARVFIAGPLLKIITLSYNFHPCNIMYDPGNIKCNICDSRLADILSEWLMVMTVLIIEYSMLRYKGPVASQSV